MKSRPWLAVAVYARAPAADAPMATDIAANSDSTLMNSHCAGLPSATSAESVSTMCVCGEIGYAAMTSGRQPATVSATARDPSSCLGMDRLRHAARGGLGGGAIAGADPAGEAVADRRGQRAGGHDPGDRGQRAEQRRPGQRPPEVLAGQRARRHRDHPAAAEALQEIAQPELLRRPFRVEEDDALRSEPSEDVDLVEEGRVLDHDDIRLEDRLVRPDRPIGDAAERDDGRTHALRAEARERLGVTPVEEGGGR